MQGPPERSLREQLALGPRDVERPDHAEAVAELPGQRRPGRRRERLADALALAVAPASGADIAESAARALATVRQVMPARLRSRIDAVEAVTAPGAIRTDPDVLVAVSEAVHLGEVLRFGYGDDDTARRVEPHAVVARNGRWYLLDWDLDRDDWRTHRIDRITPRMRTRVPFARRSIPGGDAAVFVSAQFKGSVGGDVWPCVGTAVLEAPAEAIAPYLTDDAVLEALGPGRCRVTRGSWSWEGLVAGFAAFAVDFFVEGPDELRAAVTPVSDRIRDAAAR